MEYMYVSTIGQDSHRFGDEIAGGTTVMLGGVPVPSDKPFLANSDGDVILHAITNAISGFTTKNVLGYSADKLCLEEGITDSTVYLKEALKDMGEAKIVHVSMSVECLTPKLKPHIEKIRQSVANLLNLDTKSVGITATTGEGLTGFGRGEGVQVLVILTVKTPV